MPNPPDPPPPPPGRLFWVNLGALMLLAIAATVWFGDHLQAYLTEVVVLGGAVSLWAALRLAWSLLEKIGKVDAAATSRRLLSSPEASLVLAVGAVALALLWFTTGSLYFEQAGGKADDREFVVQVTRQADQPQDRTHFIDDVTLSASRHLVGRPYFWPTAPQKLDCTIVRPLRYEKRDCSIVRGASTTLKVPGDFIERSFHLLRIVPGRTLYRELPSATDTPVTTYRLQVQVEGRTLNFDDLRNGTLYAGGLGPEMALVRGLDPGTGYDTYLATQLRAVDVDESAAKETAAKLSVHTAEWPAFSARKGQRLNITVSFERTENGRVERGVVAGFPMAYDITADKVQTLWIPSR